MAACPAILNIEPNSGVHVFRKAVDNSLVILKKCWEISSLISILLEI